MEVSCGDHLVLDQGDERRHHHGELSLDERRQLVAQRLAAARRHQHEDVLVVHRGVYDLLRRRDYLTMNSRDYLRNEQQGSIMYLLLRPESAVAELVVVLVAKRLAPFELARPLAALR